MDNILQTIKQDFPLNLSRTLSPSKLLMLLGLFLTQCPSRNETALYIYNLKRIVQVQLIAFVPLMVSLDMVFDKCNNKFNI
jgi:hypothetical protein